MAIEAPLSRDVRQNESQVTPQFLRLHVPHGLPLHCLRADRIRGPAMGRCSDSPWRDTSLYQ